MSTSPQATAILNMFEARLNSFSVVQFGCIERLRDILSVIMPGVPTVVVLWCLPSGRILL